MEKSTREVKYYRSKLIKTVKNQSKSENANEWLLDNARAFLSTFGNYLSYVKKHKNINTEKLYFTCIKAVNDGLGTDEKSLISYFAPLEPDIDECTALTVTLGAAFAVFAVVNSENSAKCEYAVKAIAQLQKIDNDTLFGGINESEKLLCLDPAGIYPIMNSASKNAYRKAVQKTAKALDCTETKAAQTVLEKARSSENKEKNHIGFYLPLNKKSPLPVIFLVAEWFLSLLFTLITAIFTEKYFLSFLTLLPFYTLVRCISPVIAGKLFKPAEMLALNEENENVNLPSAVIAVSSILPDAENAKKEYEHFAAVKSTDTLPGTVLVALYDLKASKYPYMPEDKSDINAMKTVIDRLNEDFGGGFVMALRDRVYSTTESEYTGFERKRGAISTLARLLCREENGFSLLYGDTEKLKDKKYILALDSDTRLSFEALRSLIAVAVHPLNKAEYDGKKMRITSGYGIIAPRTETSVFSASKTLFTRLFTSGGASAYSPAVSERYMDMFSSSLFTGKGLIDAGAYCLCCENAFDDGIILSHDIPEGALLRTGFSGKTVLTDSFPTSPSAYFGRKDRWIRGDIQNSLLLCGNTSRLKISPKLPLLSKFQLADNIRIALTPVFSFACLITGALSDGKASLLFLFAALAGACSDAIITCIRTVIATGLGSFTRAFFSSTLSVSLRSMLKALLCIGFIPQNALYCLVAVSKAVYRMLISKKHTLQWTTAAQGEHKTEKNLLFCLFVPFITVLLLGFSSPLRAFISVIILLTVPFSLSDGIKTKKKNEKPQEASREIILSYMASMWSYFDENVTAKDNFLPPDNIQETPVKKTAHRTSPTNIGLYLVSTLAAADVSFIDKNELYERITNTLNTVNSLLKFKGMLFNWYDTKTLAPLPPLFISTVDCGNFEVCLTALKEGLKEYAVSDRRFNGLILKIENILSSGDMKSLFDKKKGLFSIGLDVGTNKLSESYYDLFMSEAVMTSFYHIAKRDIPPSHWSKLSRPVVKAGRYTAALSWTGTAFEYFMPSLFLPVYENSFRYEALKVCKYMQEKYSLKGQPSGISESAYYSFDSSMSYRYRANGLRTLAVKRNADCKRIYSPYSAFLMLNEDISDGLKNLSEFASLHATGRYGFYEAVDFSREENKTQDYMLVRSYMAHHIGMSIIACSNALKDNIFVKRFMSDTYMSSAESLLAEKPPVDMKPDKKLYTSKEKKELPADIRRQEEKTQAVCCNIFSNAEDSLICSNLGEHIFLHSGISVLGFSDRTKGVSVWAEINGEKTDILPENGKLLSTCLYSEKAVTGIKVTACLALLNNFPVLALPVKFSNSLKTAAKISLYFYFEPDFFPPYSPSQHPAFDGLKLKATYDSKLKALSFYKRNSSSGALSTGFYDFSSFLFECDRENLTGRQRGGFCISASDSLKFNNNCDFMFPCAGIKLDFELGANEKCEKILLVSAADTPERALSLLTDARKSKLPDIRKTAPALIENVPFGNASPENYAHSVYFGETNSIQRKAINENTLPVQALWQYGISGDLPLITVNTDSLPQSTLIYFLRLHNALSLTGSANDLVFLTSETGDYLDSIPKALSECLKKYSDMSSLGRHGGIHIIHSNEYKEEFLTLLKAQPGLYFPCEEQEKLSAFIKSNKKILPSKPSGTSENHFIPSGYHTGTKGNRPYCHTLSNAVFGTLISDSSLGYTWALNSRQNKLTPWCNDVSSDFYGEKILIEYKGIVYDVLSGATADFTDTRAVFSSLCGTLNVRVTVQVDNTAMKKRIAINTQGNGSIKIIYRILPSLAESEKLSRFAKQIKDENMLIFTNPSNTDYGGFSAYYSDREFSYTFNGEYYLLNVNINTNEEICFYNIFSRSKNGLYALKAVNFKEQNPVKIKFTEFSSAVNSFASSLLLHNVFSTRFNARTSLYQCSGARGFRDSLQDAAALIPFYPDKVREQIFRSCSVQFSEGDVLHWYHCVPFPTPCFKGVRTRCSDDFLWLPLTVSEYIKATGDYKILCISIPFLKGDLLPQNENECYSSFKASDRKATVYEHCIRAIKHSFNFGVHSLPLIGTGDWNDSFSEVGINMKGESVFTAQLLKLVCNKFIPLCEKMNDTENKKLLEYTAEKMKKAVMQHGFNGKYFIRGYYDSGEKLGDETSLACKIDLLTQSFAVFADTGSREEQLSALTCALKVLFDSETDTLKLFSPPFDEKTEFAGYANSYPAGVRENGGQYTHAAVWFALALLKAGLKKEALLLTEKLCPANRYTDKETGDIFMNEPYAMSGDICTFGSLKGRGGWSLYTGSAGWYLRLLRELTEER